MEPLQILIVFLLSPSSKGIIYIGVGSKQMVMLYYIIYSPLKTGCAICDPQIELCRTNEACR